MDNISRRLHLAPRHAMEVYHVLVVRVNPKLDIQSGWSFYYGVYIYKTFLYIDGYVIEFFYKMALFFT